MMVIQWWRAGETMVRMCEEDQAGLEARFRLTIYGSIKPPVCQTASSS